MLPSPRALPLRSGTITNVTLLPRNALRCTGESGLLQSRRERFVGDKRSIKLVRGPDDEVHGWRDVTATGGDELRRWEEASVVGDVPEGHEEGQCGTLI